MSEILPEGYRMTELGPLPEEWRVVRLGDLENKGHLWVKNGYPQGEHNTKGNGVPHLRPFNITSEGIIDVSQVKFVDAPPEDSPYWVKCGDVLFNNTNSEELVGKTAYFDLNGKFVLSNHMTIIRVADNALDAYWLAKQLHWFWYEGLFHSICRRHVNQASVSLERLRQVCIPLPPLAEQCAIAHVLRTVQEAKEATARVIAAARELKKSLMRHLFTYGPVPADQTDQVPMQETELGPLPAHWRVVRLGEVFDIFAGGDISKLNWSPTKKGKFIYPVYSNSLENDGLYGYADTYQFPEGSITVTGRGNLGHAIPRYNKFNAIIRLLVLNPKTSLDIKFVAEFINASIKINLEGSSIPQLTRPKIATYSIPLPPLAEQREIARILQAVDEKIRAEEARKAALEGLFRSLLHHLMTAQVRLPQDFVRQFDVDGGDLPPYDPQRRHRGQPDGTGDTVGRPKEDEP
ncbi:MAG: restriction endonuclease subunit S [Acidobacteria bacterium]|jgi:type I restriction enzyme S subunit|nr:MAG: restriction endonuclease subunit S [Acidobacteriota bacterium]GIU81646.1 MAG: hypothetical protein KatS3mg006_0710 [Pyrinomonadaceae bacterium]